MFDRGLAARAGTESALSPPRKRGAKSKPSGDTYISRALADWTSNGNSNGDYRSLDASAVSALVERAKREGSEGGDAFADIYRLYSEPLFRYARWRLGREAAEDAVAETFFRALKGLPKYKETGAPFISWLYGIARHVVSDAGTAERKVEPRDNFPDRAADSGLSTVDHIALGDALRKLPDMQRQVIELKFLVGLTNEEVGAALGKSPGAVNAQQWRALQALKLLVEQR